MNVRKTDAFLSDLQRQFEWYAVNASLEVAKRYLDAVEGTCRLLGQHPQLGPRASFTNARLRNWRFFLVFRPFQKHLLFYDVSGEDVVMRPAMHGQRDLPRRLLQPPGSD